MHADVTTTRARCLGWCAAVLLVAGLASCKGGGSGAPDLFLVAFYEDGRTNVYRDQVLTFEFTAEVDPATVDGDTFQIFTGTAQNPQPFTGLFEVKGNFVLFNPVVDENNPKRGLTPLNPYGFAENTTYQVKIPSIADIPTPLKVLRSVRGKPIIQSFSGSFTTGDQYTPNPNEPNPEFAPFDAAVYDSRVNPPKGTVEPNDDLLQYSPVPNLSQPPVNPKTGRPDFRAGHPTNVRVRLAFTSVIDPRSINTQANGNVVLEFESPTSPGTWNFIPTTVSVAPNGKSILLTAATPLAHQNRFNKYRIRIDQSTYPILSRGGKKLVEVVERWNDSLGRKERVPVTEPLLTFWCAKVQGERGPLLTAVFPLYSFANDPNQSDPDISFGNGMLVAGPVKSRTEADTTSCTQSFCNLALREPLTQSLTSPNPNPNSKGPSKIQFHYNSYQHAASVRKNYPYKLPNAEALVGMSWGPLCNTVIQSTYPKLHIHVMWSNRDSTNPAQPQGLPSTTYNNNFDVNPPGFAVRDGTKPYTIAKSQAGVQWFSWQFQQPFTDYRYNRGLVWMAWTEVGGQTEQYPRWYSPAQNPNTRIFNPPSKQVNPAVGQVGQFTYYWTQFEFKRLRSLAVSKFFRMTKAPNDRPRWNTVVVSPSIQNLPGGTSYQIEFRGGIFQTYRKHTVGGLEFYEGTGTPTSTTNWSRNITTLDGFPAVAIRVIFQNNLDKPNQLPFLNGIAFTFELQ